MNNKETRQTIELMQDYSRLVGENERLKSENKWLRELILRYIGEKSIAELQQEGANSPRNYSGGQSVL